MANQEQSQSAWLGILYPLVILPSVLSSISFSLLGLECSKVYCLENIHLWRNDFFGHGAEAGMVKADPVKISLMCYRQLGLVGWKEICL